ncbi:MAG TPA: response regulator [Syntrophales bacterium]|nr:response regulator [Syntrophales bacterium]
MKKSEKGLLQAQKMEAIGTLAGGIAHDFNNILGAILGLTEMTLYESREASQKRRLEQVIGACDRARNLVNHILTFSRRGEQERRPVDIGIIVKESLKLLRASLPSTINIMSDIPQNSNTVFADPTQIHQIMMKLCTNAAYAMRERGGMLKIELEHVDIDTAALSSNPALKPGPYARLIVSDTGCGIDPAIIDRIFDPFFTTKKPGEGTGLGLSVVYGIVKSYGGAINVYSEPALGTTFKIYLPRIESAAPSESKSQGPIPRGEERILFVDDEEVLAEIGKEMVQSLGYVVAARTSSVEALKAFQAQPFRYDIIITDMTMPNMTGVELAREIHRIRADVPVIVCTGFSELINEREAGRLGIEKLLMKPLFLKDLALAIRDVLDRKNEFAGF